MTQDNVTTPFRTRTFVTESATSVSAESGDAEIRLPRAFEDLGTPIRFEGRSRSFIVFLPQNGLTQVAQVIEGAIDRRVPIEGVTFEVTADEEGTEELVAKVRVNMSADDALALWEDLSSQLLHDRLRLSIDEKAKMDEEFAFFLRWDNRP
jgi:hypothetical protein